MPRVPTIVRSLVRAGSTIRFGGDMVQLYRPEWTEHASSTADAWRIASDCGAGPADCHLHTKDGQRFLDIGGRVVEERARAAKVADGIERVTALLDRAAARPEGADALFAEAAETLASLRQSLNRPWRLT